MLPSIMLMGLQGQNMQIAITLATVSWIVSKPVIMFGMTCTCMLPFDMLNRPFQHIKGHLTTTKVKVL